MDKVYLVGVDTQNDRQFERSMAELAELANACEMEVVGSCVQHTQINKAIYVGPGKLEQIREEAEELQADLLLFNDSLTPSQLRNIQDDTGMAVMDRTTLILEIFASRAKSREAMLQVEVARLQYLLPRLVGLHDALSRQGGTSGSMSSRGSGEKKLELDRRRAQSRLTELRRELAEMETERLTQQKKRARSAIPRVALVGYTNAGKSTIMNSMVMRYLGDAEKNGHGKGYAVCDIGYNSPQYYTEGKQNGAPVRYGRFYRQAATWPCQGIQVHTVGGGRCRSASACGGFFGS